MLYGLLFRGILRADGEEFEVEMERGRLIQIKSLHEMDLSSSTCSVTEAFWLTLRI